VSTGEDLSATQAMSYFTRSAVLTAPVELDQCPERAGHRVGGKGYGGLEVADDRADLLRVAAAHLVDLFDELAVAFHQPGVQPVLFLEAFEVGLVTPPA
jgi:hypothetical protein